MPKDWEAEPYLAQVGRYRKATGDDLVTSHLLLAVKLAGEYRGRGVSYADLIGEANLALVRAARDYPQSKAKANGVPFSKYAARAIRNALLDAIRKNELVSINTEAWQAMRRCEQGDDDEEVAKATGGLLNVKTVRYLRQLADALRAATTWDAPQGMLRHGGEVTLADTTPDPSQDVEAQVLDALERERLRAELAEAIGKLPPLPRLAVSLRFGIEAPGISEVAMESVLRVCERDHHLENGMARMRKVVMRHEGDGSGTVVSGRRTGVVSRIDSPLGPGKSARISRDEDLWRRLASQPPPAAVGAW